MNHQNTKNIIMPYMLSRKLYFLRYWILKLTISRRGRIGRLQGRKRFFPFVAERHLIQNWYWFYPEEEGLASSSDSAISFFTHDDSSDYDEEYLYLLNPVPDRPRYCINFEEGRSYLFFFRLRKIHPSLIESYGSTPSGSESKSFIGRPTSPSYSMSSILDQQQYQVSSS